MTWRTPLASWESTRSFSESRTSWCWSWSSHWSIRSLLRKSGFRCRSEQMNREYLLSSTCCLCSRAEDSPTFVCQVQETIQSFDWFKRCFVHAVSSTDHVNISTVEHSHSVVVAWLLQVANFCPLVLWNVIHFALFGCLIWVLWANGINEIFSLELKFPVKVC